MKTKKPPQKAPKPEEDDAEDQGGALQGAKLLSHIAQLHSQHLAQMSAKKKPKTPDAGMAGPDGTPPKDGPLSK